MRGRTLTIGFLVLLIGFLGFVIWLGLTGGGTRRSGSDDHAAAGDARSNEPVAKGAGLSGGDADSGAASAADGGPLTKAIADRQVRDELRRRILAAWAESKGDEAAAAARDGRFVPIPEDREASKAYLRDVVRHDFVPMAKKCYEELLSRKKGASGTMTMKFKLVGDEKIGGVIDDAQIEVDGGIDDPELVTCMRESFLSLSFRPPPGDYMTVTYPIVLSPGDDPPGDATRDK